MQKTVWARAAQRWVGVSAVLAAFLIISTHHPYYRQNGDFFWWRKVFPELFVAWLLLGIPYLAVTLQRFGAVRYLMRDGPLHLLLLARASQRGRFWRRMKNRRVRTTVLGALVKAFYLPLMIGWFAGHLNGIARLWVSHGDLRWGLDIAYQAIFAVDCGVAMIGYGLESRWLGNKTRSVEPTAFGWLVCLACYTPFNSVTGTYIPLVNGPAIVTSARILLAFRALTVALFAIYAAATVAFGARFSNLTNRGIITRGPYRFVRHPAYLCKCSAWWLEHLPTMTFTKAIFLTGLCGVYGLRAWTEERHLSADPDYVAYKKKTPWVVFPGVY